MEILYAKDPQVVLCLSKKVLKEALMDIEQKEQENALIKIYGKKAISKLLSNSY